jgi:hypothetical protein
MPTLWHECHLVHAMIRPRTAGARRGRGTRRGRGPRTSGTALPDGGRGVLAVKTRAPGVARILTLKGCDAGAVPVEPAPDGAPEAVELGRSRSAPQPLPDAQSDQLPPARDRHAAVPVHQEFRGLVSRSCSPERPRPPDLPDVDGLLVVGVGLGRVDAAPRKRSSQAQPGQNRRNPRGHFTRTLTPRRGA